MTGLLMWGLILPLLVVVAGILTMRRRNHRSSPGPSATRRHAADRRRGRR
jgi:hypothetical protein